MDKQQIWLKIRRYVLNKYILALLIFSIVYFFIGDQSMLNRIRRAYQIHEIEQQSQTYREGIDAIEHQLQTIQHPDSLEKFARETYYMHTPEEHIYVIEE